MRYSKKRPVFKRLHDPSPASRALWVGGLAPPLEKSGGAVVLLERKMAQEEYSSLQQVSDVLLLATCSGGAQFDETRKAARSRQRAPEDDKHQ